ncbi:hypothetical protein DPMN_047915 [Dreissena polymorpha]|uniref:Uncharacterized protein n=1 Tax=Dreissena polymorpha TaxID=45954 RepID=A0A9D4D9R2_DREPO|nr:hypothetical protein DPMN_047915 [Dreissena polymorpha]
MSLREKTVPSFRTAWCNAQCIARRCASDNWHHLCESIQHSADCGKVRGMYCGITMTACSGWIATRKSSTWETITCHVKI